MGMEQGRMNKMQYKFKDNYTWITVQSPDDEGIQRCMRKSVLKETDSKSQQIAIYNPQTEGDTLVANTSTTPCPTCPPFNCTKASCAILNPAPAVSIATILIELPVPALVKFQQDPQLGEFQTTSSAPPIKGKDGTSPNVGKRAAKPFAPFEHATLFIEPDLLS